MKSAQRANPLACPGRDGAARRGSGGQHRRKRRRPQQVSHAWQLRRKRCNTRGVKP